MMERKKGRIDQSETFDEFLAAEGILAETEEGCAKAGHRRPDQGGDARRKASPKPTWRRGWMTSRRQLDRLLDPHYSSVTLMTLRRAAAAVGRTLRVELV